MEYRTSTPKPPKKHIHMVPDFVHLSRGLDSCDDDELSTYIDFLDHGEIDKIFVGSDKNLCEVSHASQKSMSGRPPTDTSVIVLRFFNGISNFNMIQTHLMMSPLQYYLRDIMLDNWP